MTSTGGSRAENLKILNFKMFGPTSSCWGHIWTLRPIFSGKTSIYGSYGPHTYGGKSIYGSYGPYISRKSPYIWTFSRSNSGKGPYIWTFSQSNSGKGSLYMNPQSVYFLEKGSKYRYLSYYISGKRSLYMNLQSVYFWKGSLYIGISVSIFLEASS